MYFFLSDNPASFSTLVLDEKFDPSSEDAQIFLLEFCDDLYAQDFAVRPKADYVCPMQRFGQWLQDSSANNRTAWFENCNDADQIPIANPNTFHTCMTAFAQDVRERQILSRNGKVTIISYEFGSRVGYRDGYTPLHEEFGIVEGWMQSKIQQGVNVPEGVKNGFFIGGDYWWYDTHKAMLETAMGSAGIALAASTLVILCSSRSFTLAIFSCLSIVYVLTSVVSTMVALGWSLGFLESICLSILIGLSADFVTHFSHAYANFKPTLMTTSTDDDNQEQVSVIGRGERTKFAIVHMGPSILAACFTTVSAAIIMLFCTIVFFEKFALVLFFCIIQATVASFIFFCTLVDCCGPSNPTQLFDSVMGRIHRRRLGQNDDQDDKEKKNDEKLESTALSGWTVRPETSVS